MVMRGVCLRAKRECDRGLLRDGRLDPAGAESSPCATAPIVRASRMPMTDFLVKRDDLRECRIAESEAPELEPGQALLRVDSFGLTANNVTYAVMGEAMSYWNFFPAADGWGRVPMWGFAEVERSEAEGVEPGTRLYGYLPPSSHLVVTPADADERGFVDASPHRAALPSAYHRYLATDADPFYRADTEEMQMLLRPLFFTSFLIDDQLADEGLADARADPDLQRLEQDRDRRRVPARAARGGRARRADLAAERRVRRGPGDLRPHRHLRRDRLARARPRHLRRHRGRRRGAPRGPLALRRRARPQHGRGGDALGGARRRRRRAARAAADLLLRARPSRQALRGLGRRRAGDEGRRRLAPVLRVDGRLARDDPRRGLRGGPERLPRRARGPRRPQDGARTLVPVDRTAPRLPRDVRATSALLLRARRNSGGDRSVAWKRRSWGSMFVDGGSVAGGSFNGDFGKRSDD